MRNPWVGLDLTAEPMAWARLLRRAYEQAIAGAPAPPIVRDVVTRSWERSRDAGVDPDEHATPLLLDEREARDRWREHPLARFGDLVARTLGSYTHDARHIIVISDADGCLLWADGHRDVLKASNSIAFVPGRLWTEAAAGTNGIGTALAVGHPVQIFSAEHFNRQVHGWTCSGAPVRDPETEEIIGVLDLSSGIRTAHPNSLALVTAAADIVAAHLRAELAERDARVKGRYLERLGAGGRRASALVSPAGRTIASVPAGWLPGRIDLPADGGGTMTLLGGIEAEIEPLPRGEGFVVTEAGSDRSRGHATLRLRVLGRERAILSHDGTLVTLSRRHSEIVTLLALRPEGLTSEELACELYGDGGKRMSVRAEIARLRRVLGARCAPDPYRLTGTVSSDLHDVERLLARGRRASALKLARGPLLPGARAPAIVAARERLERSLGRSESGVAV
jgi:GAF domain